MKRYLHICLLIFVFSVIARQVNAQDPSARSIIIENKIGKITWLFADSAASSSIFFNAFKDLYEKNNEFYEYDLNNPTEAEEMLIEMFAALHQDFFDCYYNPEEEQTVVMGYIEEDQTTGYQIYILSAGLSIGIKDINFIFIHNTVNDEQALFCDIENISNK